MFAAKLLRENDYEVAEGHGWVAQVCVRERERERECD